MVEKDATLRSVIAGPDPTALTTEQLTRESAHLKALIAGELRVIEARLDERDKAVGLLQGTVNRSPTINEVFLQHEQKFESIANRFEEKFRSIETQFAERDVRTEQSATQTKLAVDAALQAAEKAVGKSQEASDRAIAKSEASTTKQIDQLVMIIAQSTKAIDDKIDDLKGRLTAIEASARGLATGREPMNAVLMMVVAAVIAAAVTYFASRPQSYIERQPNNGVQSQ